MSKRKSAERRKFREQGRGALAIERSALDHDYEAGEAETTSKDCPAIAVLCINGPLEHHPSWWWASYDEIVLCAKAALEDEQTKALVLRIDSPGGDAAGMVEAARKLRSLSAKHKKPIYAYADECAASGAYGIACGACEIWLPESGRVGSVGVILEVVDATKRYSKEGLDVRLLTTGARKGDGHPAKPIDDDVESALQAQVDTFGDLFFKLVAEARGMKPKAVAALEAGVFLGIAAVDAGLADDVGNFDEFIAHVESAIGLAQSAEVGSTPSQQAQDGSTRATERRMSLMQALATLEEKKKALAAAKTDKEKSKAMAELSTAIEAATKYKKKTVEESEESDDEEAEEESEEESEESEEEAEEAEEEEESEDSTGAGSSTGGSTKDTTEAEEEAKALLTAKTGLYTHDRLFRLCSQVARTITGKKRLSVEEIFGAIDGAGTKVKAYAKVVARNEKLEGDRKTAKVNALITSALDDGRLTPAGEPYARTIGMRSPKELAGFLATQPKRRTLKDGAIPPNTDPEAYQRAAGSKGAESTLARNGHGATKPVQLEDFNRVKES